MGRTSSRTIFVGNLPGDIREREVEDIFYKYGHIVDIDLKIPPKPPSFAFVEFEDSRDAEDAIDGRDGYDFYGHRLRVELAHGGRGRPSPVDRYSNPNSGSFRGSISRRSDFRVLVSGLPSNASWQDLKDHMRRAGDVCFSQVYREGRGTVGIVDYTNYDDMKYAIRKLDHSEFRNAFGRAHVRVKEYGSRSPSPRSLSPRSRSRSPRSRSPISSDSLRRSPSGSSKNPSPPRRGKQLSSVRSRSRSVSSRSRGSPKKQSPPRRGKQLSSFRSRSRSRSVSSRSGSKGSTPSGSRSRSIPPSTSPLWGKRMSLMPKEQSPGKNRSLSASP